MRCFLAVFIILLTIPGLRSNAQGKLARSRVYLGVRLEEQATSGDREILNYLRTYLIGLLDANGLTSAPVEDADFLVQVDARTANNRVDFGIEVRDNLDKSVVFARRALVFPGLLAQEPLQDSAEQAIKTILNSQSRYVMVGSIDYALTFEGPEDGVQLWLGEGSGRFFWGSIQEGKYQASYYPFELGKTLWVSAEKEGYWPRSIGIPLTEEPSPVRIDPLYKVSHHQLLFSLVGGRLGYRQGYRYFLLPDKFMIGADFSLWIQSNFKTNATPFYNQEIRLNTGSYLFFPEDHWFRFMAGTAWSWYLALLPLDAELLQIHTFTLEPMWIWLEWNQPWFLMFLEARFPFILPGSTLLTPQWGNFIFSIGVGFKW